MNSCMGPGDVNLGTLASEHPDGRRLLGVRFAEFRLSFRKNCHWLNRGFSVKSRNQIADMDGRRLAPSSSPLLVMTADSSVRGIFRLPFLVTGW
jgi:hypothetical protein